jgi:hypothetical protein
MAIDTGVPATRGHIKRALLASPPALMEMMPQPVEREHPSGGVWPAMVALVTQGVDGIALVDPVSTA